MAPQIVSTPMMTAQMPMKVTRMNAVIPGQKNAARPARMLTTPLIAIHQRCPMAGAVARPEIAAHSAKTPSTSV